jgi:hypothetical protein
MSSIITRLAVFLTMVGLVTLTSLAPNAAATTLVNLSTGYDQGSGSLISYGSLDDNWSLVSAPAGAIAGGAKVTSPNPAWFNPDPYARWISSQSLIQPTTYLPAGHYVYQYLFPLTMVSDLKYSIAGDYGSDDITVSITLNDNILDVDGGGKHGSFPSSFLAEDQDFFNDGINTLLVTVNNVVGPGSFVMRGFVSGESISLPSSGPAPSPNPEPATLLLLGSGLAGLGLVRRRKRA